MIRFEGASFGYSEAPILSAVDLHLASGGFYFVTGPSGAGKTTFLRLCDGTLRAQAGRITVLGEDLGTLDRDGVSHLRRRLGVVHQDCQFLDHLSVRDNIALPLHIASRKTGLSEGDIDDLLAWVDLAERSAAMPPTLSGGERQRAALARAVILSPEVILADEPTGNIDASMSQRILSLLIELHRMGRTIVIATHDLALVRDARAANISPRTLRLQNRQIQVAGSAL